jgi:uncharacterized protein with HEPN domain
MNSERDSIYLAHILECIEHIQDYIGNNKETFMNSSLVQDAVLRRLQTMAESTQKLSDELKTQAPEVDWRGLSGFRNILVHDYLNGIDLEQVWNAITVYLPNLELAIKRLSANLSQDNN